MAGTVGLSVETTPLSVDVPLPPLDEEDVGTVPRGREHHTPKDRHGNTVINTSGGGGNAAGEPKLRDGPFPIWFRLDDGLVTEKSVWCGVAAYVAPAGGTDDTVGVEAAAAVERGTSVGHCSHAFCAGLSRMEVTKQYEDIVVALATVLRPHIERDSHTDLESMQWRQLIVLTVAFATRATAQHNFPTALQLIRKAESLVCDDLDMTEATKKEVGGYIADAYAYYLLHRGRLQAALDCTRKASKLHAALAQHEQVCACCVVLCDTCSIFDSNPRSRRLYARRCRSPRLGCTPPSSTPK